MPAAYDLLEFERGIDSVFNRMLPGFRRRLADTYPAVDVSDDGTGLTVVAELPGVQKEDLSVSVHDGELTISGKRKSSGLPEKSNWLRNEIPAGAFSRTIALPSDIRTEGIEAELKNGILKVSLPKAEEARPREITVH
jgi:HSP20 family protein